MLGEPPGAERFRPQIERALAHAGNERNIEDLYAAVLTGSMQLWKNEGAIVFTEILCYPRLKALRAVVAAGDLQAVRAMVPKIMMWARTIGCKRAEFAGRSGWIRALKLKHSLTMGWSPVEDLL